MDLEFEWDEEKRLTNKEKHKIDFQEALPLFEDGDARTVTDTRHTELRLKTTGMAGPRILTAV
jgi:uncharacterized protein